MERKLIYEAPLVDEASLPTGLLCASNVDPGGLEIPFPGFSPENKW
jgi:hypothetical protein